MGTARCALPAGGFRGCLKRTLQGIDTRSLRAQGEQRRSVYFNIDRDIPGLLPQVDNDIRIQVGADRKRRYTLACEGAVALYAFEAPCAA